MDTIIPLLVTAQAFGAVFGTYAAVRGELAYIRARRDGRVDEGERAHLAALARGLRLGMSLVLVSSLGLVIAMYAEGSSLQPGLTTSYWALVSLALLITIISWALSRKRISFALGSAIAFTGWWFLAHLALGSFPALSYGAAVGFFVVATGILYFVLHYLRHLSTSLAPKSHSS